MYKLFPVDILHDFEIGVWKSIFTHLRILTAYEKDKVNILDARWDFLFVIISQTDHTS